MLSRTVHFLVSIIAYAIRHAHSLHALDPRRFTVLTFGIDVGIVTAHHDSRRLQLKTPTLQHAPQDSDLRHAA
jgi:hypothetical protein